jgi:CheY-like chemotaxis protein/exonuclease VII small subunit
VKRLLVVDDHESGLYFLRVLLEGHGYGVELARNGVEALKKARENPPDLIISDILMPEMDGFTLCREWRADDRLGAIPFIFYTATYTDPRDEKLGLGLGADAFITKPAEPEDFLSAVRAVLSKYETEGPTVATPEHGPEDEGVLRQYNEALIRKLEDKTLRLEEANRSLEQEIAAHSETEEMLRRQMACDRVVEELLSRVAGASASEIDGHMAAILQAIAEFMGAESVMVSAPGVLLSGGPHRLSEA